MVNKCNLRSRIAPMITLLLLMCVGVTCASKTPRPVERVPAQSQSPQDRLEELAQVANLLQMYVDFPNSKEFKHNCLSSLDSSEHKRLLNVVHSLLDQTKSELIENYKTKTKEMIRKEAGQNSLACHFTCTCQHWTDVYQKLDFVDLNRSILQRVRHPKHEEQIQCAIKMDQFCGLALEAEIKDPIYR